MLSRGIIFIVFGSAFNALGAYCCRHSRKFTRLPFQIITNIPKNSLHPVWREVGNTFFDFIDVKDGENRAIKCQMPEYSKFDIGMLLDTDAFIQRQGIDDFINKFKGDLCFNKFDTYTEDRILGIYKRACKQFDCAPPIDIYNGALCIFRKSTTKEFFDAWLDYWEIFGKMRDMPPLACLIQKMKDKYRFKNLPEHVFSPHIRDSNKIIQHHYGKDFHERVGMPERVNTPDYLYPNQPADWSFMKWDG